MASVKTIKVKRIDGLGFKTQKFKSVGFHSMKPTKVNKKVPHGTPHPAAIKSQKRKR